MDQIRGTREQMAQEMADQAIQLMNAFDQYHDAVVEQTKWIDDLVNSEIDLEATQDAIILDPEGPIDGKNAEIRAAQLRAATEDKYLIHRHLELTVQQGRMHVADRLELLRTMRALSAMISGTSHA